jgi:hypothetical protein
MEIGQGMPRMASVATPRGGNNNNNNKHAYAGIPEIVLHI